MAFPAHAAEPNRPEIWLTPFAPLAAPDGRNGAPDYFDLFQENAPWPYTAAHIKVFKIYNGQIVAMSDDQLRTIIQGVAARHLALAVETDILTSTSSCGSNGWKAPPVTPVFERRKKLGADLRYVALDEPLLSGHDKPGPVRCHASIQAVADDVAASVKPLYALYPNLQVGDIEPIGRDTVTTSSFPDEIAEFMADYQKSQGRPFAFMEADTVWGRPWQEDLKRYEQVVHAAHMPFGIIYNGDFSELSDAAWAKNTARYAAEVEDKAGVHADHVIFQSWDRWPQHTLPETNYTTMTGMVRDYLRARTTISSPDGQRVLLTDETGEIAPNATIQIQARGDAGSAFAQQRISGEVPPSATSALIALRVNAECNCPQAPAYIAMTGIHYAEKDTGGAYDQAAFDWDLHQWVPMLHSAMSLAPNAPAEALKISSQPNQPVSLNGPTFPVHAGAQFQATFGWDVNRSAEGTGYLSIIFLGDDKSEKRRTRHLLTPTWLDTETITTDQNGYATIPARYLADQFGHVSFTYAGDANHRPTRFDLR